MDPNYDIKTGIMNRYEYASEELPLGSSSERTQQSFGFPSNPPTAGFGGGFATRSGSGSSEFSFGYNRSPSTLSEGRIEELKDLAASCPGLLPFSVYTPSVGVSTEIGAGHTPVDISFFTNTAMSLYERLLVARTIGKAISELHMRNFWCGKVSLDAIVAGTNGFFGLSRYCVGKIGGYTIPTELIISDIQDFGTLLGTLCLKKTAKAEVDRCFGDEKSFMDEMEKPTRQDLFAPLRRLYTTLTTYSPEKSPPEQFLKQFIENELEDIIIGSAIGDNLGKTFWRITFGVARSSVPWADFMPQLLEFLDIHFAYLAVMDNKIRRFTTTEVELRCLKAVLTDDCDSSLTSAAKQVTAVNFGRLCDLFGPLTVGPEILINLKELMQEPWFHGELHSLEAARQRVFKNKSFLIRFSLTYRDRFTLSTNWNGTFKNYRLKREKTPQGRTVYSFAEFNPTSLPNSFGSLVSFIEAVKDTLGLLVPAEGSPFFDMFTRRLGYVSNSSYVQGATL
eukprot:TRINITY_DN12529_c0_g1_i1.p1 TRINITY_DN12529_c0_g1~~TRINITY_DN12529_c0_g1_i1.p1  ORF type:complete len:507 (-),score=51.31 TRINITY_DN12529_c0_g1_i1:21-1541(-)